MSCALGERGDAAEFGVHSGGEHYSGRFAGGARRSAEHHVAGMDEGNVAVTGVDGDRDRRRLSGQRGRVHLKGTGEQARVGGHAVALGYDDDVAGDEVTGVDLGFPAVPQHAGPLG